MAVKVTPSEAARNLGLAVIESGLDAWMNGTYYAKDEAMLFFESGNFELYCWWAGIEPKKVYEKYKSLRPSFQSTLDFYDSEKCGT